MERTTAWLKELDRAEEIRGDGGSEVFGGSLEGS